jgi:CHAD domain-containing protein
LVNYRQFLTKPVTPRSTLPNARRPIENIANEQIWHAYARVRKQGDSIKKSSPALKLHSLRKSCKILRYLLESFSQLYDSADMTKLINTLKELQDNLGSYNDLHVQIAFLQALLVDSGYQTTITKNTMLAIKQLMKQLQTDKKKHRAAFRQTYKHFWYKSNHALYQHLFKQKKVEPTQKGAH